jgi:hypothetical protein
VRYLPRRWLQDLQRVRHDLEDVQPLQRKRHGEGMIAVVVPWGTDNGPREAVWQELRAEWEQAGCDLIVASDPLFGRCTEHLEWCHNGSELLAECEHRRPFSVARAINRAVRLAPPEYDRFACFGADAGPCAETVAWAAAELERQPWTLLFDRGQGQNEAGEWSAVEKFATPCVGPIAFTRAAFETVDGYDERYEGWAYEDVDFWNRLQRDVPRTVPQTYPGTALRQYWHPVGHHDLSESNPNVRLFSETWG